MFGLLALIPLKGQGEVALTLGEAEPPNGNLASVPVSIGPGGPVWAMQLDVLFDPTHYSIGGASIADQPGLTQVNAREIEPGRLRVVVYRAPESGLTPGAVFSIPLTANAGIVDPFPIIITNPLLVGDDASPIDTRIVPQVRMLTYQDGDQVNGRFGLELSVVASPAITRVEYFVGGISVGQGSGSRFAFRWNPPTSGPYEIHAIAYDVDDNETSTRTIPIGVEHVGTYAGGVKGTYIGLIRGTQADWASSGYVSMTTAITGAFTYRVLMGSTTLAGKGVFNPEGTALLTLPRRGSTPLSLQLTHSSDPAVDQILGKLTDGTIDGPTVTGGTFTNEFRVDRIVWNAKTNPATTHAGAYTVLLPASGQATGQGAPIGDGWATAAAGISGVMSLKGILADGEKLTHSSYLSKDGAWPIYRPLYRSRGMIIGEATLRETPGVSDGDGIVEWLRLSNPKSTRFASGFKTQSTPIWSRYAPPAPYATPLLVQHTGGNGLSEMDDPTLASPIERLGTLNPGGSLVTPLQGGDRLAMGINPKNGVFTGSFVHPQTGVKTALSGVLFQKQNLAAGTYLTSTTGGRYFFAPHPDRIPVPGDALPIGVSRLPTISIASPKAEAIVTPVNGEVIVLGTAKDPEGIAEVWCQVFHEGVLGAPVLANGTTSWSMPIAIPGNDGGRITVIAKTVDGAGNESLLTTRSFLTFRRTPLTVAVVGPGGVSKGFLGITERQVGQMVTVSATPAKGRRFVGWTGSIQSPARTISFLMEEGMSLTATFAE